MKLVIRYRNREIKDKSKKIGNRNFVIMACHSGSKEKPKICVEDNLGENIKIGDNCRCKKK